MLVKHYLMRSRKHMMIGPDESAHELSVRRVSRVGQHAEHGRLSEGRDGMAIKVQEVILRAIARNH
jgi:hypothetical protein